MTILRSILMFALLAMLLWGVELLWPEQPGQKFWRRGSGGDLLYLLFDVGVRRIAATLVLLFAIAMVSAHLVLRGLATAQPAWLQVVEILVAGDVIGYGLHRFFHRPGLPWRFHSIHHSSVTLDWVAAFRLHPVDSLVHKALTVLPFVLLGFNGRVLAAYAPFLAFYPIVLHANVRLDFGPFRWLIASPAFHRWHHTAEAQGFNRNFAGLFPGLTSCFAPPISRSALQRPLG